MNVVLSNEEQSQMIQLISVVLVFERIAVLVTFSPSRKH